MLNSQTNFNQPFSGSVWNNPGGPDVDVFVSGGEVHIGLHDGARGDVARLPAATVKPLIEMLVAAVMTAQPHYLNIDHQDSVRLYTEARLAPPGITVELAQAELQLLARMLVEAQDVAKGQLYHIWQGQV